MSHANKMVGEHFKGLLLKGLVKIRLGVKSFIDGITETGFVGKSFIDGKAETRLICNLKCFVRGKSRSQKER